MQYKLIGDNNTNDIITTVLKNRGIESPIKYLNLDESVVQDYNHLDNMRDAVECFIGHYEKQDKIMLLPDEDCDGYTSSAMLYLYVKSLNKDYPIEYIMHDKPKQHGLVDVDLSKFNNASLVIIADASSNDAYQCNKLIENGINVIILDHHDENYSDEENAETNYQTVEYNNAIIVNNQLSENYENKNLSGAGIVYRFLQALDEELWADYADKFLDLCALGNIADMMDMRSFETRYIVNQGINSMNNNFLKALASAQEFSTKGIINIHNVAWFFAPVINSVTRIGSSDERALVFKAMTEQYDEFDYKKRDGTVIKENIYDRAARIAKNIKSRQDKQRDVIFNELKDSVDINDKVVILESKNEHSGLLGLSCIKLSNTIKRPVIILKESEQNGKIVFNGSCRNFDGSPIENLKDLILQTKAFEFCSGHGNAAGLAIKAENISLAKEQFKKLLVDVDFNLPIPCDFIFDINDLSISFIYEVDKYNWLWGTGIKEPKVAVENIQVKRKDIHVQGKNFNSVTFVVNDIKFVQFNMKEDDPLLEWVSAWDGEDDDQITLDVVGTVGINAYQGVYTAQFIIENSNLTIQN